MSSEVEHLNPYKGLPRVFVYGTLKKGFGNHRRLDNQESHFLGRTFLKGDFHMLDIGGVPGIVELGSNPKNILTSNILGEVYAVTPAVLVSLDILEGHPTFYERRKVTTEWKNTWCYFLDSSYLSKGLKHIPSGIWKISTEEIEYVKSKSVSG